MWYSIFLILGHRRTLTCVRTPLYDRQYELTEKCNSDPELQSTFSLQSKRRNTLPTSPIEYIRQLKKRKDRNAASQNGTGDAVGGDVPATEKISTKRKEKKAWDIVYFVVGGQSFQCPEWIFQGHPQTLLGNLARRNVYFHAKTKAYYFAELLPDVFTAVCSTSLVLDVKWYSGNLLNDSRDTLYGSLKRKISYSCHCVIAQVDYHRLTQCDHQAIPLLCLLGTF